MDKDLRDLNKEEKELINSLNSLCNKKRLEEIQLILFQNLTVLSGKLMQEPIIHMQIENNLFIDWICCLQILQTISKLKIDEIKPSRISIDFVFKLLLKVQKDLFRIN